MGNREKIEMADKEKIELSLHEYITAQGGTPGLFGREYGLKAAKELGMLKLGRESVMSITVRVPPGIRMDDRFIKAFFGPLTRKMGTAWMFDVLRTEGGHDGRTGVPFYMRSVRSLDEQVHQYLVEESTRIVRRQDEKAKSAKGPVWSAPISFFVPEIGTVLWLEQDWAFRLYTERRNDGLTRQIGIPIDRNWRYENSGVNGHDVVMRAGAVLSVNRVYIRQGAKEYSSITFNVRKGAVMTVVGKDTVLKKGARFWAKLSDVNNMVVCVDTQTLTEN